ncbi:MAG: ATP synthase F1 subunit epsilon [Candidatus Melainabacteria bacterium]|nr:ATP synthase F1 subunit epsilon [Candidatus Melainabacteria bacterium]
MAETASEKKLHLKIMTPERTVIEETVEAVYASSPDGQFGVLPKHIPMVRPLSIGVLAYVKEGQRFSASVIGGMFSTDGQAVLVLTDAAEKGDQIDRLRAEEAKKRAESRLQSSSGGNTVDVDRAKMALARAMVRLKVASKI